MNGWRNIFLKLLSDYSVGMIIITNSNREYNKRERERASERERERSTMKI